MGVVTADFPVPAAPETHGPARVLALCNQKGGVGKTTTTINLGAALAGYGMRVLLVDFDPQGALTLGLGVPAHDLDRSIHHVLTERDVSVESILRPTDVPGMDLVPASIELAIAEITLVGEVAREFTLAREIAPVLRDYDVVLVDCQPSLGLLTVNALTAANGVLVPVEPEFFALRGVGLMQQTIGMVQARLNPTLTLDGLLLTRVDPRTKHARDVRAHLEDTFGDLVLRTTISRTIKFPESTRHGQPIMVFAPDTPAAESYWQLARELVARWAA
jgi:chromosome partitioning protein